MPRHAPSPYRAALLLLAAVACWCGPAAPAGAADLAVSPVVLHLDPQRDRSALQVHNRGSQAVTVQADAIAWLRQDGNDLDRPTDALVVNPPVFTVPAGQSQWVRLGLRQPAGDAPARAFRLVLRQVPAAAAAGDAAGGLTVLLVLRIPVYVAPREVQRDARWQLLADGPDRLAALLTNAGNVHLRVGALRLLTPDAAVLADSTEAGVLFPGESRRFPLARRDVLPVGPWTLEARTDQGVQRVAVERPQP